VSIGGTAETNVRIVILSEAKEPKPRYASFALLRMTIRRRSAFAAAWIFIGIVASGCEDSGVRPTTTIQATDSADQVLEGFSHYVTNDGIRRSRVEADTAYFYEGTQVTNLTNLKVTFYDLKGAESSTLTAKRGVYRWQDGSMEANDQVVVVSPDGRRLATERLRYDNATNQISTDRRFTFERGEEHLEGNSFRSDPDFRNVVTDRPRGVAGDGMLLPGQRGEQ
jgi:LPS export ABC transporter protein LptC